MHMSLILVSEPPSPEAMKKDGGEASLSISTIYLVCLFDVQKPRRGFFNKINLCIFTIKAIDSHPTTRSLTKGSLISQF